MTLTEAEVLALAPDDASRRAARQVAVAARWQALAADGALAWGRVRGSGSGTYEVVADADGEPGWRCTCPSRKQPCKHVLGLLLLAADGAVPPGPRPLEVAEWAERRTPAEGRPLERIRRRTAEVADPEAQARRRARREALVDDGVSELRLFLDDLVRGGLAAARSRPLGSWDATAARLVDAQAPGLAARVRELGGTAHGGPGWPGRLLERLGRLHLLVAAWEGRERLPPGLLAEVRSQVGFPASRPEVEASPPERDRWECLGRELRDDGTGVAGERIWLRARSSGAWALLSRFGGTGSLSTPEIEPGTAVEADVHRYPGTGGHRALLGRRLCEPEPLDAWWPGTVAGVLDDDARALARNPWHLRTPVALAEVVPARHGDAWWVVGAGGDALPLAGAAWPLLALSGGHPLGVMGEWDGERLAPWSAWTEGRLWAL